MRAILVVVLGIIFPCTAFAQYEPATAGDPYGEGEDGPKLQGLVLSLGVGYAVPFGDALEGASLNDVISGAVPLVFGAGYRANPFFSAGLDFIYAPAITKNCEPGNSCSASDVILELELRLHVAPDKPLSPWLSTVVGYEWLSLSDTSTDLSFKGLLFGFQAGGDYHLTPAFALGPYFGVRFGQFDSVEVSQDGTSRSGDIPDSYQTWHGWFTFGLQGAFTL